MSKTIGSNGKQYKLEKIIGKGSFGKVYSSGQYAVKQVSLDLPPYLKTALQTEIKILRSFNHPNIVSLVDVVYQKHQVYLVMQFCQTDLSKYLKINKIDQKKAIKILKQIISGFSKLVDKGIIHRDLKPANILVNKKGEFKLADFGFAKYVDHFQSKLLHSLVGTPLYMAPQILNRAKYTTKCDIWSIGVIFYELLTSKMPWNGTSQQNLLSNINKKPLIIPEYVSEWPAKLLKRMLVINEKDRIGWDQLIKQVLSYDKSNNSSTQSKDSQSSNNENVNALNARLAPQSNKKQVNFKTQQLLLLFQLQLLQHFTEQRSHKMMHQVNYRYSVEQLAKIKKVLKNFIPSYQQFIEKQLNLVVK